MKKVIHVEREMLMASPSEKSVMNDIIPGSGRRHISLSPISHQTLNVAKGPKNVKGWFQTITDLF